MNIRFSGFRQMRSQASERICKPVQRRSLLRRLGLRKPCKGINSMLRNDRYM
jgi:hypothetical protein